MSDLDSDQEPTAQPVEVPPDVPTEEQYRVEIDRVLPADLPHRERVVSGCALHLSLVACANLQINLTRIVDPAEAAIKHVLDSLAPWHRMEDAGSILDLGSGAGFPGVPLALVFPSKRVILSESTKKKAEVLYQFVEQPDLGRVEVTSLRAEEYLLHHRADVVVARAVGSIQKLFQVLRPVRKRLQHLILYKGPNVKAEMDEAMYEVKRFNMSGEVTHEYELPGGAGRRTIVEYRRKKPRVAKPRGESTRG